MTPWDFHVLSRSAYKEEPLFTYIRLHAAPPVKIVGRYPFDRHELLSVTPEVIHNGTGIIPALIHRCEHCLRVWTPRIYCDPASAWCVTQVLTHITKLRDDTPDAEGTITLLTRLIVGSGQHAYDSMFYELAEQSGIAHTELQELLDKMSSAWPPAGDLASMYLWMPSAAQAEHSRATLAAIEDGSVQGEPEILARLRELLLPRVALINHREERIASERAMIAQGLNEADSLGRLLHVNKVNSVWIDDGEMPGSVPTALHRDFDRVVMSMLIGTACPVPEVPLIHAPSATPAESHVIITANSGGRVRLSAVRFSVERGEFTLNATIGYASPKWISVRELRGELYLDAAAM